MTKTLLAAVAALALSATPALAGDCNYKKSAAKASAVKVASAATSSDQEARIYQAGWGEKEAKSTIVDIAAGDSTFSTLVAAVQAADLVDTLGSEGPFTVFAPTNAAFDALPAGTVDSLLLPENKAKLVDVLTYHVVPGKVYAGDLTNGLDAATAQGMSVNFDLTDGAKVNGANIVKTDIKASNGVVHVIDAVLLPPSMS